MVVIIQISVSGIVEVEYVDATEPMKNSVEKGIDSISARTAVVISKRKSVRRSCDTKSAKTYGRILQERFTF